MPVTTPMRSPSRTKSALLPLSAMRWPACSMVASPSMNTARDEIGLAHPGAQHALHAAFRPVRVGEGVELPRNLGVEEGGEGGVAGDQLQHHRLRDEEAERLLGRR